MSSNLELQAFALTLESGLKRTAAKAEERQEKNEGIATAYAANEPDETFSQNLHIMNENRAERSRQTAVTRRGLQIAHTAACERGTFSADVPKDVRRAIHDARISAWDIDDRADRKAAILNLRTMARRALKAAMLKEAEAASANGAK